MTWWWWALGVGFVGMCLFMALFDKGGGKNKEERQKAANDDKPAKSDPAALAAILSQMLGGGKHLAALNRIEKWLRDKSIAADDPSFAPYVAESFVGLAEGKSPQAVLDLYESLKADGVALVYAEQKGQLPALGAAMANAMLRHPEINSRAALLKTMSFISCGHPLMLMAMRSDSRSFARLLARGAQNVFSDWENDESDSDLRGVISRIETKL